jgi:threonine/homoserine/homoserine lactone efflux protein
MMVPYIKFFVRVPADWTLVAASVAVVVVVVVVVVAACLVGYVNGRLRGWQRGIDGRTRKARILAAVLIVMNVVCSLCDTQLPYNRVV